MQAMLDWLQLTEKNISSSINTLKKMAHYITFFLNENSKRIINFVPFSFASQSCANVCGCVGCCTCFIRSHTLAKFKFAKFSSGLQLVQFAKFSTREINPLYGMIQVTNTILVNSVMQYIEQHYVS